MAEWRGHFNVYAQPIERDLGSPRVTEVQLELGRLGGCAVEGDPLRRARFERFLVPGHVRRQGAALVVYEVIAVLNVHNLVAGVADWHRHVQQVGGVAVRLRTVDCRRLLQVFGVDAGDLDLRGGVTFGAAFTVGGWVGRAAGEQGEKRDETEKAGLHIRSFTELLDGRRAPRRRTRRRT